MPRLKPVPDDALLKHSDVLRRLNIGRTTLYNIRRRGLLPSVRLGGVIRFRPRDVERYIRLHTRKKIAGSRIGPNRFRIPRA